jgi:hypothetical protein
MCVNVCGCVWMCVDVLGCVWTYMVAYECVWKCTKVCRCVGMCVDLYECLWMCMNVCGCAVFNQSRTPRKKKKLKPFFHSSFINVKFYNRSIEGALKSAWIVIQIAPTILYAQTNINSQPQQRIKERNVVSPVIRGISILYPLCCCDCVRIWINVNFYRGKIKIETMCMQRCWRLKFASIMLGSISEQTDFVDEYRRLEWWIYFKIKKGKLRTTRSPCERKERIRRNGIL